MNICRHAVATLNDWPAYLQSPQLFGHQPQSIYTTELCSVYTFALSCLLFFLTFYSFWYTSKHLRLATPNSLSK